LGKSKRVDAVKKIGEMARGNSVFFAPFSVSRCKSERLKLLF
jgi:hypothetical protein